MKKLLVISFWLLVILGLVLVLPRTECARHEVTTTVSENAGPVVSEVITYTPPNPNPYHKLYEEMLYPTVRIETPQGVGSGVVISHRDTEVTETYTYILTAAHVVGDYSEVQVEIYNEISSSCLSAFVVMTDTNKDLALLRVLCPASARVKSAQLAPKDYTPYLFTPVWTVGCSLGLKPRPSFGHLCALCDSVANYWEVSAPILPGNSGGGVFDAKTHELIGITVWVRVYGGQLITTMAGIVPIQTIYEFLDSHRGTEVTERK